MNEMKNAIASINSRHQREEGIGEIEDRTFEITQSEEKKRKKE